MLAHIAQSVERVLGKNEVSGSTPDVGSMDSVAGSGCFQEIMGLWMKIRRHKTWAVENLLCQIWMAPTGYLKVGY